MLLSVKEIQLILDLLRNKYGPGYSLDPAVAQLQAKLSVMLEAKLRVANDRG